MSTNVSNLLYLVTIVTFILALRFLSNPAHARRGNQLGAVGMLVAIVVTWIKTGGTSWWALALGMLIGGGFGAVAARKVKMTAMPQMVALFNGVGGGAAALISLAELHRILPDPGRPKIDIGLAIVLSGLIGAISFAGSMIAFGKLQELIRGRPITYPGQKFVNFTLIVAGFDKPNSGFSAIKRQVERIQSEFPDRYVFLLPKDQFATIRAYYQLPEK